MTKEKIALIAGCSHSAGSEIDGSQDSVYNRDNSFGSVLARKLGYRPLNIAICGATNSGISRSILRWFDQEYNSETMDVFVIIGWTESSRLDVPAQDRPGDYFSGNPHCQWYDPSVNSFYRINYGWQGHTAYEKETIPEYQKFMAKNEIMLEIWGSRDVLMTQYFLKTLNIDYVMCSTMHMFTPKEHFSSYTIELIDDTKYYNLREAEDQSFYWKYKNLGYNNPKAMYWHHDEEPHRLYAEELYNFIGEQK